jgi:Uma2 family endonuclease
MLAAMAVGAPHVRRYTVDRYLALVDEGVLRPDEPVELLEGLIVAEPPQNPAHASATYRTAEALRRAVGRRALVRTQLPFIAGSHSLPEPDVAVVRGAADDYDTAHPTRAVLVVEVADASLVQDRLTKAPIYAAAGVPEYWIVNLRDDRVEVFRRVEPRNARYAETSTAGRGDRIGPAALPGATVAVSELLPRRRG